MKSKKILAVLVMTGALLLTACGNNEKEQDASVQSSQEVNDSQQEMVYLKDLVVEDYVTLGDYKNIQITKPTLQETDINWEVLYCISDYVAKANGGITDRAVVNGDLINLDYAGYKDGEAFGGGTATNQLLGIGTGQFIEGFEEGLVGVKPGETVDLELKFPEKYHSADLAGAEVVFTCTVNFIIPNEQEVTDATIQSFGIEGVTNAQELRSYVTDYMQTDLEEQFESAKSNLVLQAFIESCTFGELPEEKVEADKAQTRATLEMQANAYGMDVNMLVQYMYGAPSAEAFVEEYSKSATMQLLATQAVANKEGLDVSDEELGSMLQEYATAGGYASVEEYCGDTDKESFREYFMYDKVLNFLVENATITN